ncbi:6-carboxytetrahydropterin synthase QueD [Paenibacillus sp. MY03]|uniref:6-pyruvoyl trahydropterin synthase family protein n=1 Tax=Paenibacillus sp. MY03 TaxID=302980 RepID=UPI000B3BEC5E|nr:6-pyruvoyl tetrahydropterin synthase family protein [Paenibacillus sp. MY03]OUS77624.1 6-carboxytetrahydropterin synthase QueD [Paenibacillus sp. MY03]
MLQQIYPSVQHDYCYELNKDFHFAAAHYIPSDDAGKCRLTHGHTYFANVTVAGEELDDSGFLVNFAIIKQLIHNRFDHTLLNEDTDSFDNGISHRFPTTEVVARVIHDLVQTHLDSLSNRPQCLQVFLRETPTSYCIYRPKRKGKGND